MNPSTFIFLVLTSLFSCCSKDSDAFRYEINFSFKNKQVSNAYLLTEGSSKVYPSKVFSTCSQADSCVQSIRFAESSESPDDIDSVFFQVSNTDLRVNTEAIKWNSSVVDHVKVWSASIDSQIAEICILDDKVVSFGYTLKVDCNVCTCSKEGFNCTEKFCSLPERQN